LKKQSDKALIGVMEDLHERHKQADEEQHRATIALICLAMVLQPLMTAMVSQEQAFVAIRSSDLWFVGLGVYLTLVTIQTKNLVSARLKHRKHRKEGRVLIDKYEQGDYVDTGYRVSIRGEAKRLKYNLKLGGTDADS